MRILSLIVLSTLTLCATAVEAKAPKSKAKPGPLVLSGDNRIVLTVNGKPQQFQVDPGHPGTYVVNPSVQSQANLKPTGLIKFGFAHAIGPIRLTFRSGGAMIGYGAKSEKRRVLWSDRLIAADSDGVVGPNALPNPIVTFVLGPQVTGEKDVALPLDITGIFGYAGAATLLRVGDVEMPVRFSLLREENLITAPTGSLLANSNQGTLSGGVTSMPIRFGVARPTRVMKLATPLLLGGRPISQISVRVSDFGDALSIPDENAEGVDRDEIIVTAKSKRKPRYELLLGRSFLAGCSSLTYDFPAKLIRLRCVNPG